MNIYLFCFVYVLIVLSIGSVICLKCPISLRYFFLVYLFLGLVGISYLVLSCNAFFYGKESSCKTHLRLFSMFSQNNND